MTANDVVDGMLKMQRLCQYFDHATVNDKISISFEHTWDAICTLYICGEVDKALAWEVRNILRDRKIMDTAKWDEASIEYGENPFPIHDHDGKIMGFEIRGYNRGAMPQVYKADNPDHVGYWNPSTGAIDWSYRVGEDCVEQPRILTDEESALYNE